MCSNEIPTTYRRREPVWRMAYVRGRKGITVSLAERVPASQRPHLAPLCVKGERWRVF